jgi:Leucine-rich repeat (LRR) protein
MLITILHLSRNTLTGDIPPTLGGILTLVLFDLSFNGFPGTMPLQLQYLFNLTHLNLSRNNLKGRILSSLGKLSLLISLDLSLNNLTGHIPAQLGYLASLTKLQLSSNGLTGATPASLGSGSKSNRGQSLIIPILFFRRLSCDI